MRSNILKLAFAAVAMSVSLCTVAATQGTDGSVRTELSGLFESYLRDSRKQGDDDEMSPCEKDFHCLADYFSRRYLASFAQRMADLKVTEGAAQFGRVKDALHYGLRISKTYGYEASTTAPNRAVLTVTASDAKGVCLPLIRISYIKEFTFWRIDRFEEDSSEKQVCNAAKVISSF